MSAMSPGCFGCQPSRSRVIAPSTTGCRPRRSANQPKWPAASSGVSAQMARSGVGRSRRRSLGTGRPLRRYRETWHPYAPFSSASCRPRRIEPVYRGPAVAAVAHRLGTCLFMRDTDQERNENRDRPRRAPNGGAGAPRHARPKPPKPPPPPPRRREGTRRARKPAPSPRLQGDPVEGSRRRT